MSSNTVAISDVIRCLRFLLHGGSSMAVRVSSSLFTSIIGILLLVGILLSRPNNNQ